MRDVRTLTDVELDAVSGGTRRPKCPPTYPCKPSSSTSIKIDASGGDGGNVVAVNKNSFVLGLVAVNAAVAVGGNGGNGGTITF